jgi:hypothetical protein
MAQTKKGKTDDSASMQDTQIAGVKFYNDDLLPKQNLKYDKHW